MGCLAAGRADQGFLERPAERGVKFLKVFFTKYKAWFFALIAPLGGPWAVFAIAFLDASALGIPMDPVIAFYVYNKPHQALIFAIMGALGSALGGTIPYLIGYKGGEALIVKRVGQERFAPIHSKIEKYGDLALIIPCLLPPGFPMKLFLLSAGVAEMNYFRYLLSMIVGRLLRFTVLAGLTIYYGPEVLSLLGELFRHHRNATLGGLAAIAAACVLLWLWLRRRKKPAAIASAE